MVGSARSAITFDNDREDSYPILGNSGLSEKLT